MLHKDLEERLRVLHQKYLQLQAKLSDPETLKDIDLYSKLSKEFKELEPAYETYNRYTKIKREIESAKELLENKEFEDLAKEEIKRLEKEKEEIEREIKRLLVPKDERDAKNVILEIRAGVGGEEAALFAADLLNMYQKYAEEKGWKFSILSAQKTGLGGYKEVIALIEGKDAYAKLKYESGVHRVQRVPKTEAGGRIHTSTATVAVLPEADETEVQINPEDLKIETFPQSPPAPSSPVRSFFLFASRSNLLALRRVFS